MSDIMGYHRRARGGRGHVAEIRGAMPIAMFIDEVVLDDIDDVLTDYSDDDTCDVFCGHSDDCPVNDCNA